jgi:serine/threonine-protein kinase
MYGSSPGGYAQSGYGPYTAPQHAPQTMQHPGGYGSFPPNTPQHAQTQKPSSMHPAFIVLITLAVVFAVGAGGCMVCVCVGAAAQ